MTWLDLFRKFDPDITGEEVEYFLWNETCYPFDYETTIKQIENYYKIKSNDTAHNPVK